MAFWPAPELGRRDRISLVGSNPVHISLLIHNLVCGLIADSNIVGILGLILYFEQLTNNFKLIFLTNYKLRHSLSLFQIINLFENTMHLRT